MPESAPLIEASRKRPDNYPFVLSIAFPGLGHLRYDGWASGIALMLLTLILSLDFVAAAFLFLLALLTGINLMKSFLFTAIALTYGLIYTALVSLDSLGFGKDEGGSRIFLHASLVSAMIASIVFSCYAVRLAVDFIGAIGVLDYRIPS